MIFSVLTGVREKRNNKLPLFDNSCRIFCLRSIL